MRELQHLLLGWELMGDARREAFALALERYIRFYLEHMRLEETALLPEAERLLTDADLRRSMGEAGRQRVAERYSIEAYVAGVMQVLDEAAR